MAMFKFLTNGKELKRKLGIDRIASPTNSSRLRPHVTSDQFFAGMRAISRTPVGHPLIDHPQLAAVAAGNPPVRPARYDMAV